MIMISTKTNAILLLLTLFISIMAKPSPSVVSVKILENSTKKIVDKRYTDNETTTVFQLQNQKATVVDQIIYNIENHKLNKKNVITENIKNMQQNKTRSEKIGRKNEDENIKDVKKSVKNINKRRQVLYEDERFRSFLLNKLPESVNFPLLNFSNESITFWKTNYTHEIFLPFKRPEDCSSGIVCTPMIIEWKALVEMQSEDIVSIEINDTFLKYNQSTNSNSKTNIASVYQVTRLGFDNCDITEGELLDANIQNFEDKKVLNLYDKDLTEGLNLLIVVSDAWFANQCVRLSINMKSNDCGDNVDCSRRGYCFSNSSMEGYECACFPSFVGPHCEELDACIPSNPCKNNGICIDFSQGHNGNKFQCLCPYGFYGNLCSLRYKKCVKNLCLNGGQCLNRNGESHCECARGFQGKRCELKLPCETNPCKNGGTCWNLNQTYLCSCQSGFRGKSCEDEIEGNNETTIDESIPLLILDVSNNYNGYVHIIDQKLTVLKFIVLPIFLLIFMIIGTFFISRLCNKKRKKNLMTHLQKCKRKIFFLSKKHFKEILKKPKPVKQRSNNLNFISNTYSN